MGHEKDLYAAPRKAWLKQPNGEIVKREIIGETSRSWLHGAKWRPDKYAKADYKILTDDEREREITEQRKALDDALWLTDPIEPDINIPTEWKEIRNGWLPTTNGFWFPAAGAQKACTSSNSHSTDKWGKTESQQPRRLYSTELLALKAARSELAEKFAKVLMDADRRISEMEAKEPK